MKVLVNGPTGICISEALNSLKTILLKNENVPDSLADKVIKIYSLEEQIKKDSQKPLATYLDRYDFSFQESQFISSFKNILKQIEDDKANHSFISMNYPYFRDDRVFPAFPLQLIQKFSPDVIITLIDDAISCWARITLRQKDERDRSYFRLRDMFTWRATSILFGDFFAKTLGIKNYVVAVKHPPTMLYNLLFKSKDILKIYASYPMSNIRQNTNDRKVIDGFRMKLHENFCVFDPVTIDDRRGTFDDTKKTQEEGLISKDLRWPLPQGFEMVSEADIWKNHDELKIPIEQFREVSFSTNPKEKSIIDKHILYRDYRLIHDSHVLIAGRPFYKKHHSQGVTAEIQYAVNTAGKECYLWWNPAEDGSPSDSPFGGMGNLEENLDQIISTIENKKSSYFA